MFAVDDRVRSLRRLLIEVLGAPPWIVRVQRETVQDNERPAALVEPASPVVDDGPPARVTVPQGDVDKAQTFALLAYPPIYGEDGRELTPAAAARAARDVANAIDQAVASGVVLADGRRWSWPYRLPLFDFSSVPIEGPARRGPQEPYAWMWVQDLATNVIADPEDPLRYTVACNLRVGWRQGGAEAAPAPILRDMPGWYTPPGT